MNPKLNLLKKVLKPITLDRAEEIARSLAGPAGHEQLTLEDAGLTDEVAGYILTEPVAIDSDYPNEAAMHKLRELPVPPLKKTTKSLF